MLCTLLKNSIQRCKIDRCNVNTMWPHVNNLTRICGTCTYHGMYRETLNLNENIIILSFLKKKKSGSPKYINSLFCMKQLNCAKRKPWVKGHNLSLIIKNYGIVKPWQVKARGKMTYSIRLIEWKVFVSFENTDKSSIQFYCNLYICVQGILTRKKKKKKKLS